MSSGSDVEMQSALPKKAKKKTPKSPSDGLLKKDQEPKKISTREMIKEALGEMKSRKGTSLYAIKKHITEKHNVNVDKIGYIIKKAIKMGVEDGTIVQTKGVGATGSFRLAPKQKPDPSDKPKKKKMEKSEKTTKSKKEGDKVDKTTKKVVKSKDPKEKAAPKKTVMKKSENSEKTAKSKVVKEKSKMAKEKSKMAKEKQTPAKKRAMMNKRKSIGSIIKPPKMKPKAKM